jgi:ABC-type oligopeptide transport system substrate-binding subunit
MKKLVVALFGSVLLAAAAAQATTPVDFGVKDPMTLNADQYNAVTHWNTQPGAVDKLTDNMEAGRSGPRYRGGFPSCARGNITQPTC